ncbi:MULTISPECIES: hypothetical protein [Saliniramus]|uniref:hypothetical protein n=1 Tax=Saliniramus TaxID=2919362 RepID=UPI001041FA50|nr:MULTISPECIES: hypothetical protein [Saliniramus]HMB10293.1 hypothetical protein [Saliniramus sp.]
MSSFDIRSRIERANERADELRKAIINSAEYSTAFSLYAGAIENLVDKSQQQTALQRTYGQTNHTIIQGQIDQYAEKYDQIESWMRHYG